MEQDNDQTADNNITAENTGTQPAKETKEEKLFNQEQVNDIVKDRWKEERKKMPSKEELDAFHTWQENNKTEAEKNEELTKKFIDKENENLSLKNEIMVLKKGVTSDDVDYVVYKVSKMEGDFETNLTEFLKNNDKYVKKEEPKPTTTGISQNGINSAVSDEKAYLDKKYANNPYYKK